MGKWLERALASVPLVPLVPIAERNEANGTIGTIGTTSPNESATVHGDDIEREERLAVYGEPEDDAAQDRGEIAQQTDGRWQVGVPDGNAKPTAYQSGDASTLISRKEAAAYAGRFEDRPANWMPEPGPGVTILRPAVEVPAAEYDRHLDTMIAALPAGSPEAYRLAFAKKKGWCVDRGGERIFTRGRA